MRLVVVGLSDSSTNLAAKMQAIRQAIRPSHTESYEEADTQTLTAILCWH
jgi:hypothetical protein